jgi:hypothetical protein
MASALTNALSSISKYLEHVDGIVANMQKRAHPLQSIAKQSTENPRHSIRKEKPPLLNAALVMGKLDAIFHRRTSILIPSFLSIFSRLNFEDFGASHFIN